MTKLLDCDNREAYFESVITIIKDDRQVIQAAGRLEGIIAKEPIGNNGFGYDPIFFLPDLGLTMAQLSSEKKNAISHRRRALALAAKEFLDGLS